MKFFSKLLILLFFTGLITFQAAAQNEKRAPVIIELFTSEGCSTCPPADKFLQTLVEQQPVSGVEVIGLSEHVDYWNRLGWIDPFSSAQFSNRQAYYSAFFKHSEVYTPQMIADGTIELMGKEGSRMLAAAAKNPKANLSLKIEPQANNSVAVTIKISDLPEISGGNQALLLLAITEDDLTSNVAAGENRGQKLKHSAVTRYLKEIGEVRSERTEFSAVVQLGENWKRNNLRAVAFIQEQQSRRIVGAAQERLGN